MCIVAVVNRRYVFFVFLFVYVIIVFFTDNHVFFIIHGIDKDISTFDVANVIEVKCGIQKSKGVETDIYREREDDKRIDKKIKKDKELTTKIKKGGRKYTITETRGKKEEGRRRRRIVDARERARARATLKRGVEGGGGRGRFASRRCVCWW